jgi:hypothetical protein
MWLSRVWGFFPDSAWDRRQGRACSQSSGLAGALSHWAVPHLSGWRPQGVTEPAGCGQSPVVSSAREETTGCPVSQPPR